MKIIYTSFLILFFCTTTIYSQPNWTQKADFGGIERVDAIGFSIGTKGYIGTGRNSNTAAEYVDFWEYDPSTNTWTQKADFGGGVYLPPKSRPAANLSKNHIFNIWIGILNVSFNAACKADVVLKVSDPSFTI